VEPHLGKPCPAEDVDSRKLAPGAGQIPGVGRSEPEPAVMRVEAMMSAEPWEETPSAITDIEGSAEATGMKRLFPGRRRFCEGPEKPQPAAV